VENLRGFTYSFSHISRKVGNIEIGGVFITLSLEAGVEGLLEGHQLKITFILLDIHTLAKPTS